MSEDPLSHQPPETRPRVEAALHAEGGGAFQSDAFRLERHRQEVVIGALTLAVAAVDLHKRTVIYTGGQLNIATAGYLKKQGTRRRWGDAQESLVDLFRHFQQGGGQLWIPAFYTDLFEKAPSSRGIRFVDEKTLLTFLMQDTLVLNF